MLIAGRPGAARGKQGDGDGDLPQGSFFFKEFPSLEEYALAYDWTQPFVDHGSKEP